MIENNKIPKSSPFSLCAGSVYCLRPVSAGVQQASIRRAGFISVTSFLSMKRAMPWSDDDEDKSSDESSSLHSDSEHNSETGKKKSKDKSREQKSRVIDFDALKRHGFKGGPSVLNVPPPKEGDKEQDWSWSTGKERRENKEVEESYEERQKTRTAISLGEQLSTVQTQKEKKNASFSQKEKRKRELGQASRGKNYVEEEKRLLRDSGIYSGFDT